MACSKSGWLAASWAVIHLLLLLYVGMSYRVNRQYLVGCSAARNKLCSKTERSARFTALWLTVLAFALTVAGVSALRHSRNDLTLGIFIGGCLMLANWFLVNTANYANIVWEKKDVIEEISENDEGVPVDFRMIIEGAAALSAVLTFSYVIYAGVLFYFREELISGPRQGVDEFEDDLTELSGRTYVSALQAQNGKVRRLSTSSSVSLNHGTADSAATAEARPASRLQSQEAVASAVAVV